MDEILDNVEKRGVEKGFAEGLKKGENKLALLMKTLFTANRFEDADRASKDEAKRNQLYQEFGIQ